MLQCLTRPASSPIDVLVSQLVLEGHSRTKGRKALRRWNYLGWEHTLQVSHLTEKSNIYERLKKDQKAGFSEELQIIYSKTGKVNVTLFMMLSVP